MIKRLVCGIVARTRSKDKPYGEQHERLIPVNPGPSSKCEFCDMALGFNYMGVSQHLRKHVRLGDISDEQRRGVLRAIRAKRQR